MADSDIIGTAVGLLGLAITIDVAGKLLKDKKKIVKPIKSKEWWK